jgi:hypothetical protein
MRGEGRMKEELKEEISDAIWDFESGVAHKTEKSLGLKYPSMNELINNIASLVDLHYRITADELRTIMLEETDPIDGKYQYSRVAKALNKLKMETQ